MKTRSIKEPDCKTYDRIYEKVYVKYYGGILFGFERKVFSKTIKEELVLEIITDKAPDLIIYNGKEYEFKKIIKE